MVSGGQSITENTHAEKRNRQTWSSRKSDSGNRATKSANTKRFDTVWQECAGR